MNSARRIVEDDRTPEQCESHRILVVATDRFLSGWGPGCPRVSIAAWACASEADADAVERWVRSRREMKRVRRMYETNGIRYRPRCGSDWHLHVYVGNPERHRIDAG